MDITIIIYALHLWLVAGVPAPLSIEMHEAATAQQVDPYDLAAYLLSEHSSTEHHFELVAGMLRGPMDWGPSRDGAAGELGIFSIMPRWFEKAGYSRDQASDPLVSAHVAAYVLAQAHESHEACKLRRYSYHGPMAHVKCSRDVRDVWQEGQCAYSQRKLHKLRHSLDLVFPTSLKPIGSAWNQQWRAVKKRAERDMRRAQRRALRQMQEQSGD